MAEIHLLRGDFGDDDWDTITEPTHQLMATLQDIHFHNMADGEWQPDAAPGDAPGVLAEVRELVERLETRTAAVRQAVTVVEQTAVLRAQQRRARPGPVDLAAVEEAWARFTAAPGPGWHADAVLVHEAMAPVIAELRGLREEVAQLRRQTRGDGGDDG